MSPASAAVPAACRAVHQCPGPACVGAQVDYKQALVKSYQFYGSQMIGQVDPVLVPAWRSNAFTYEEGAPDLGFGSLTGGFITGSTADAQAGTVKMTVPTAYSVAMLAWGYLAFPQASHPARCV